MPNRQGHQEPPIWAATLEAAKHAVHDRRFIEAEALYQDAARQAEATLGPTSPELVRMLGELLHLQYCDLGDYVRTEPTCLWLLRVQQESLGVDHPDLGGWLHHLARAYERHDRLEEAEAALLRAVAIREAALPPDDPDVLASVEQLAQYYQNHHRYAEAEPLLQRLVDVEERSPTADYGARLDDLARLYRDQGRSAEAVPLYERLVAVQEQRRRSDLILWAMLSSLADAYAGAGQLNEADQAYRRAAISTEVALAALTNLLPESHRERAREQFMASLALLLRRHAGVLRQLQRQAEAAELEARAEECQPRSSHGE
jgi:tetratricopeptide (TPR) repeat protein